MPSNHPKRASQTETKQSWVSFAIIALIILVFIAAIALLLFSVFGAPRSGTRLVATRADARLDPVFEAYDGGDTQEALRLAGESGNEGLVRFFEWRQLDTTPANTRAHREFILTQAHWPNTESMARRFNSAGDRRLPAQERLEFFALYPPQTGEEHILYFRSLEALNQTSVLRQNVSAYWKRGEVVSDGVHRTLMQEFGDFLELEDHIARFHQILSRSSQSRALPSTALTAGASQMRDLVPPELDLVRVAWATGAQDARDAVPAQWQNHAALRSRDAWFAQGNDPALAQSLFLDISETTRNAAAEWRLRRILIRNAVRAGDYAVAHDLAASHGLGLSTDGQIAEVLAGWIALTYLDQPSLALSHYQLVSTAQNIGPWVHSKSLRGLARAQTALGRDAASRSSLRACAAYATTFYALLCKEDLDEQLSNSGEDEQTDRSDRDAEFYELLESTEVLIAQNRPERDLVALVRTGFAAATTQEQLSELAALVQNRDDLAFTHTMGVAARRGEPVFFAPAMRNLALNPAYQNGLEPALTLAVIAQESQFRPAVGSSAGARGLMQLLPSTAQQVAAELDMEWTDSLLTDPEANVRLGNAYLAKLMERYDGSVLLALAAYNAGPGRVTSWLRDFGDPRTDEITPEDWIDAMTISETRLYVQRVFTNLYLYRAAERRAGVDIDLAAVMTGS